MGDSPFYVNANILQKNEAAEPKLCFYEVEMKIKDIFLHLLIDLRGQESDFIGIHFKSHVNKSSPLLLKMVSLLRNLILLR